MTKRRYFEVTASWGQVIAVEDGPAIGFDPEEQAIDFFCETFDLKEFLRGAEAREIEGGPGEDYDPVVLDSYGDPIDEEDEPRGDPTPGDDPQYRQAMTDAGRGHLLR